MDVLTRTLEESDIPAIIELTRTVWGGHDHLPRIIHGWLSDHLCFPFVLEYGSEVVTVANLKSVDDGVTGWMEGLRVHPDHREKGLAKYMTKHLVETATEKGFKRIRLVTAADNQAPQKLAKSVGMSAIDGYAVFWKRYGRGVKWIKPDESISKVEPFQVLDFIRSSSILFPSRSLVFHWDVYDATIRNLERIGKRGSFFISESLQGRGLSLAFRNDVPPEPEWCFTSYASSPQVFESHVNFHLKLAREQGLRDLLCIHSLKFKETYSGIRWLKKRGHEIELLLFERVL